MTVKCFVKDWHYKVAINDNEQSLAKIAEIEGDCTALTNQVTLLTQRALNAELAAADLLANANNNNNGGNGGNTQNARLAVLQRNAVFPGTTIKLCGGNTDVNGVTLTTTEKIAMLERAIPYLTDFQNMQDVDINRLRPVQLPSNKSTLKAMLPNGIVVSKKTTCSELQVIVSLYVTVSAFRAEAAQAAA